MPKVQKRKAGNKNTFEFVREAGGITEHLLNKNGLRVIHCHLPNTDTVTVNVVYMVGSRHEEAGKTGLAHMFEHMMFKATKDAFGKRHKELGHTILQNKGAVMNATTWTDRTNYFFHLTPQYFDIMLETEAARMRGLIIEEKEFIPERQNVLSEYEMGDGNPLEALDKLMNAQAFHAHGYGHSTIGFKSDVEKWTLQDLSDFYDRYYWPNNAYLVVVGDIPLKKTLERVSAHFGRIPPSPKPIPKDRRVEPVQEGERRVSVSRPSPLQILGVGYKAPPLQSYDWAVGQVILTHLADGPASVLDDALIETHLASSIEPMLYPSHDPYLLLLYIHLTKHAKHANVENVVLQAIDALAKNALSKQELARAKTKIIAHERYGRDGTLAIAQSLTEYIASGDWTRYHTILKDVARVSTNDVMRFARTYLTEQNRIIGTFKGTL